MESNKKYSTKYYWDNRFKEEETYEWIANFEEFGNILLKYLKPDDKILHIGCGNSKLSQQLFDRGFKNITNLDFSSVIVEKGIINESHFSWTCDDITKLKTIPSKSFDIVLEKAVIESITTKEKSPWNYSKETSNDLDNIFQSIQRVLKIGGKFISISFTQPHFRIPHMLRYPFWDIVTDTFGTHFHFFIYVSTLGCKPSKEIFEKYENFLNRKTSDNLRLNNKEKSELKLNQIQNDKELKEDENSILQWLTL
ncbi:Methyltransferase domain-containing protein [Strongyloides ratti]|uniref:Methyltransferase domain-containing protein n=1 Tax=Strongyloides ratti TaxID=34506 RepID=A0A090LE76_STRRB|nr:Methyltransferase domain-containing protein [Strongyloides ratti]CEF68086.1 Methyltransferase domain-containing protein [Strongyloides ratti]